MEPRYSHHEHEHTIYQLWSDHNIFNPDRVGQPSPKSFTVIMPPPNANDPLHIGHAMFIALEDIMVRYHRMLGDDTLWLPGTDHAGIETQFVFEKKLQKQGKSRFQFDRTTLYKMIWDYVQENSDVAVSQMKKLGASADWSRFRFTLDPEIVDVVLDTFKQFWLKKLIYRDLKLVNYCTKCGTSYSELEVNHVDQTTPLYYVKYRFVTNPKEYITVATVRPEPIFVDTHLAVNPHNPKTKALIGQQVLNPLTQLPMTIIADEFVDPEFGTGIVKLTPAHDHNDFEVAQKHKLPIVSAFTLEGKLTSAANTYAGLSIAKAREQIVADLQAQDLIEKIDTNYQNRIGTCYRCGRVIEPLPLPQFFIKVAPLTEPVITALDAGELRVHGAGHDKILRHWLENLKDWNISRQIVWGIRMPVWYKIPGNETKISVSFLDKNQQFQKGTLAQLLSTYSLEEILTGLQQVFADADVSYTISEKAPTTGQFIQETDTFDTWFSSSQWPFCTVLTTQPNDFERFYPTSVMETGYDILPFWVMRMLMIGYFATKKFPFRDIYLHGLVRDQQGKKMSKSKGNVINPLEIIDQYGADALRMALVIRSSAGLDKSVGEADFKAMRNFTNKLWNATRFVLQTVQQSDASKQSATLDLAFQAHLSQTIKTVTQQLTDFKIGLAAETLHNDFWHWYCDEQIEHAKTGALSPALLLMGMQTYLKLLHPFMPFITETLWQKMQQEPGISLSNPILAAAEWPT